MMLFISDNCRPHVGQAVIRAKLIIMKPACANAQSTLMAQCREMPWHVVGQLVSADEGLCISEQKRSVM